MDQIINRIHPRRIGAIVAMFAIALGALVLVPVAARAGDPENDAPNRPPLTVSVCQERAAGDHPRMDSFLDELVADQVINAEQADEIEARLEGRHLVQCVARIVFERGTVIEATAEATSTEPREVIGAMVAGQSLADFAAEHGVDESALVVAIMVAPSANASGLVASGAISQETADEALRAIESRVSELIQSTEHRPRRFHGGRWSEQAQPEV